MRLLNCDLTMTTIEDNALNFYEFNGSFEAPLQKGRGYAIHISEKHDGRIFSLIEQIRNDGYDGEIVLSGLGADQAPMAFGVGVNSVLVPEGEDEEDWQRAAGFIKTYYGPRAPQSGATNIIELRHNGDK